MRNYEDNPEGLEPEDYIDEFGEAGPSAWDEQHGDDSYTRRNRQHYQPEPQTSDDSLAGCIAFVVLAAVIGALLFAFL